MFYKLQIQLKTFWLPHERARTICLHRVLASWGVFKLSFYSNVLDVLSSISILRSQHSPIVFMDTFFLERTCYCPSRANDDYWVLKEYSCSIFFSFLYIHIVDRAFTLHKRYFEAYVYFLMFHISVLLIST